MQLKIKIILVLSFLILISCNSKTEFEKYLETAEQVPQTFLPEILDSVRNFRDITFTPEMDKFYFTEIVDSNFRILYSKIEGESFCTPRVAEFSNEFSNFEPKLSFDGNQLYFASDRPSEDKKELINDFDIWVVNKNDNNWSTPKIVGPEVSTSQMEYFPTITKSGKLYFGRNNKAFTRGDIYSSTYKNGMFTDTTKLPTIVNLPTSSFNAFISPNEDYLIFSTYIEGENGYHSDMYISFNLHKTEWTKPIHLGNKINSPGLDHSPYVTNDGKYFFFSSTRNKIDTSLFGNHNIFFMEADFIEDMRASFNNKQM